MAIRFFNTYSRELENFAPLDPAGKLVRMYTCGPTVYNHAHIGNFRAYVFEDLLQRHLEARGFEVLRVMNLTDVDDKTIRNSRAAGKRLADFTAIYKTAFFEERAWAWALAGRFTSKVCSSLSPESANAFPVVCCNPAGRTSSGNSTASDS